MSDEGYEIQYIQEAFYINWIVPLMPNANEFKKELATYVDSRYVVASSSGTSTIHMELKLAGVG